MIETRLLTGSSHYSNFQGTHRRKNRRIIHVTVKPQRIIRWSNPTSVLYVIRSTDSIWNASALCRRICFFFWMINMLCFAWSFNISHILHLSSRFPKFFRFFFNLRHSQDISQKSIMFYCISKCSFKNSSTFWKSLRRTSCFSAELKHIAVKYHHRTACFQISSLAVTNGVHLFQSAPKSFLSSWRLIYHCFFICQAKIQKKLKKS